MAIKEATMQKMTVREDTGDDIPGILEKYMA